MQILDRDQEALLKQERQLLSNLRVALARFGMPEEDQRTLDESIRQLDEFFLLVVVGEFNSGKSALINALVGETVLEEGEVPTTSQVTILRYGEDRDSEPLGHNLVILTAPVALLRNLSIVDTPGTNSIIQGHQEITSRFVPRSDLVLFVTSADRAYTDSERVFLERIRDWGKKVIVLINKVDILDSEQGLARVEAFVADGVRTTLGFEPQVFPVSARLAQRAKHGEPELWASSRLEPLERFIADTLDECGRLQLKLLNPLGVGSHLIGRYLELIDGQMSLFQADVNMLGDVERQLVVFRDDMQGDFRLRMSAIENVLLEMEQRGRDFFEETFRLRRVMDLLDKRQIRQGFERQVVATVPQQIEQKVNELIDWLVDSDLRQWQAVNEHLADRRRQHKARIVGEGTTGGFHSERERMFGTLGREVKHLVDDYDREQEARVLADGAQAAVAAVAAVEVGAVGLGALVVALATTVAADVTGLLMASLIAVLGIFIIPNRRRRAEREMRRKIADLRLKLANTLSLQFQHEMEGILQRIDDTIAPYTRFVRAERDRLLTTKSELETLGEGLASLRARIEALED